MSSFLHARRKLNRPPRHKKTSQEQTRRTYSPNVTSQRESAEQACSADKDTHGEERMREALRQDWSFDEKFEFSETCYRTLEARFFDSSKKSNAPAQRERHRSREKRALTPRSKFMQFLYQCLHDKDMRVVGAAALFIGRHGGLDKSWLNPLLNRFMSTYDVRPRAAYVIQPLLEICRRGSREASFIVGFLIAYAYRHCQLGANPSPRSERAKTHNAQVIELLAGIIAQVSTLGSAYSDAVALQTAQALWSYKGDDIRLFKRIVALSSHARDFFIKRFEKEISKSKLKSLYSICRRICELGVLTDQFQRFFIECIRTEPSQGSAHLIHRMIAARQSVGDDTEELERLSFWMLSVIHGRRIHAHETMGTSPLAAPGENFFDELQRMCGGKIAHVIKDAAVHDWETFVRMCRLTNSCLVEGRSLTRRGRVGLICAARLLLQSFSRFSEAQVSQDLQADLRGELDLFILGESDSNVLREVEELLTSDSGS